MKLRWVVFLAFLLLAGCLLMQPLEAYAAGPPNFEQVLGINSGTACGPTSVTVNGSGAQTAGQNSWVKLLDQNGQAYFVPAWK